MAFMFTYDTMKKGGLSMLELNHITKIYTGRKEKIKL